MTQEFQDWLKYLNVTAAMLVALGWETTEPMLNFDEFKAQNEQIRRHRQN